jgi:prepilin signal peptidase PulO-like enzyme (type II secretory pathway)
MLTILFALLVIGLIVAAFIGVAVWRATLTEDLGPTGRDVTSESVIPADARFSGVMDSRDAIIVAGFPLPPPSSATSIRRWRSNSGGRRRAVRPRAAT